MGVANSKENIYKGFFKRSMDMLCVLELDGRFKKVNGAMSDKMGYSKRQLEGDEFIKYILPEDHESVNEVYKTVKKGSDTKCKSRWITKKGKVITIEWTCSMEMELIMCIGRDITEQETVLFSKQLLEKSEKTSLSGCWSWDISNDISIWSKGFKSILEMETHEEESYDKYMGIIPTEDQKILEALVKKCVETKESYFLDHKIIINEEIKYVRVHGEYVTINNINYLQGVIQDNTTRRLIEKDLINAKEKAEKASKMKSQFVSNISHEIRTPLNGITGMINLLQEENLTDEQHEYLEVIQYSSGLLLSIINNVLDFSKIESGIIEVSTDNIDVKEFISNTKKTFINSAGKILIKSEIKSDVPAYIKSDKLKLRQILTNLISNAIKFTDNGSITIIVSRNNNFIKFQVIDTGIGIKKNCIEQLFNPFVQTENTTKIYGGTGLGLTICKKLVNVLDGEIKMESIYGEGTTVSFEILNKDTCEEKVEFETLHKKQTTLFRNKMIIIVEDNNINQIIIKKYLERLEYTNYIIYNNGEDVLNNIEILNKAAIIFMDIHMPVLDGYGSTIRLREMNIKCPIIALTANALNGERERCLKIGMNDFILKPMDIKKLKEIIDKWM
jgi:PAS domain S-box-containing protein